MGVPKKWGLWLLLAVTGGCASALIGAAMSARPSRSPEQALGPAGIFTPGHATLGAAVAEFFGMHATPVQPIHFTHKVHLANNLTCEVCHTGVSKGPVAGIPSAKFCMACHLVIAKDKPEIQKLTSIVSKGQDVAWQRVYDYPPSAHVRFNHAPHIRAGVNCSNCHGDVSQQTVAVRSVNLNMGYCVNCHQQRQAPTDCLTCHY